MPKPAVGHPASPGQNFQAVGPVPGRWDEDFGSSCRLQLPSRAAAVKHITIRPFSGPHIFKRETVKQVS